MQFIDFVINLFAGLVALTDKVSGTIAKRSLPGSYLGSLLIAVPGFSVLKLISDYVSNL